MFLLIEIDSCITTCNLSTVCNKIKNIASKSLSFFLNRIILLQYPN